MTWKDWTQKHKNIDGFARIRIRAEAPEAFNVKYHSVGTDTVKWLHSEEIDRG